MPATRLRHGHTVGRRQTPEYSIWLNMVERCRNPKKDRYGKYGARGIRVCDRWLTFEHFLADMGSRPSNGHSLDRVDNDGNYEPENCRWATRAEQARNTSRTHMITIDGTTKCLTDWCRDLGTISVPAALRRLAAGVSHARLFDRPSTKLTQEQVDAIRAEHAAGAKRAEIAKRYGVSWRMVNLIVTGQAWANAKENP